MWDSTHLLLNKSPDLVRLFDVNQISVDHDGVRIAIDHLQPQVALYQVCKGAVQWSATPNTLSTR